PDIRTAVQDQPAQAAELGLYSETATKESASSNEQHPQVAARPAISPRARRLAVQLGIDAAPLRGSGRTGRTVEKDVREAANRVSAPALTVMRRTIAQRTSASFSSTPHFYLRSELDATALTRFRG